MSEDRQDLCSIVNELTDEIKIKSVSRVIRVLQEAGFCVYSPYEKEDGITFAVPCATVEEFPQNYFSNN